MADRPTVSLCLICKNEADCLCRCLSSAQAYVDEIIVVDTGSEDETRQLALSHGAAVYDYAWNDSFSQARNYGLGRAAGDWILILDADEVMQSVDSGYFAGLLKADGVEGYYVNIFSFTDTGEQYIEDQAVRLFRNNPGYRFTGVIHEQVAGSIKECNQNGGLLFADITLLHFGYLNRQIAAKSKFSRNSGIIAKALNDSPHDPFLHYSLAVEYRQTGRINECVSHLETALKYLQGGEGYFHNVLMLLGMGLWELNEYNRLHDFVEKALLMYPGDQELIMLKAMASNTCKSGR